MMFDAIERRARAIRVTAHQLSKKGNATGTEAAYLVLVTHGGWLGSGSVLEMARAASDSVDGWEFTHNAIQSGLRVLVRQGKAIRKSDSKPFQWKATGK